MATCFVLYVAGVILYGMITEQNFEDEIKLSNDAENIQSISDSTFEFISWNIGYLGLGEESDFFYDGGENVISSKELVQKKFDLMLCLFWRTTLAMATCRVTDRPSCKHRTLIVSHMKVCNLQITIPVILSAHRRGPA